MDQQVIAPPNMFSWNELMTSDVAAAKEFYGKLFGWEMRDEHMSDMVYTLLLASGEKIGGMMVIPTGGQGMAPVWGAYVTVDDVDKQVQRAEQLGAHVLATPRDIPGVGRYAVIRDPQGAMLSLITYHRE